MCGGILRIRAVAVCDAAAVGAQDAPDERPVLVVLAAVVGGTRIEGTTKTGRSRTVSIDASTVQILREHRARQAAEQLAVGTGWRGTEDYVFTTGWGEPVHPDTVSSLMADLIRSHNEAQDQAGELLPRARLHDLRHIHATTLLLAGVPVQWSRPGSVMLIRRSHCGSTLT